MDFGILLQLLPASRRLSSAGLLLATLLLPVSAQAQSLLGSRVVSSRVSSSGVLVAQQQQSANPNVQVVSPTLPQGGIYTIQGGQRLISEANTAIGSQNYNLAAKRLQDARIVMNQLSNFYQSLSSSFLGIDSQAYDSSRIKALEAAQLRDQATYQLALVYRAQNQPEMAIPLLIEIIRSQNPTRDLGQKSYQQLLELGFVDTPFRGGAPAPATQTAPAPRPPAPAAQPTGNPRPNP